MLCSRTGGLSLLQGPEKGWCTSMSRGMASSPFEGAPRELVSSKILQDEHGTFKVELFQFTRRNGAVPVGRGTLYCSTEVLWKLTPNQMSQTWIHLCWFLGVNEYPWKYFLELQSPLVFFKMRKGGPKTRWNYEGDFPVLSPQREWQQAGRFWTCSSVSSSLAQWLVQKPILFRNFAFGASGCFQQYISAEVPSLMCVNKISLLTRAPRYQFKN